MFPTGSLEAWSLGSITQVYLHDTDIDIISAYQNAKCICSIKSKTEGLRLRQPLRGSSRRVLPQAASNDARAHFGLVINARLREGADVVGH